MNNLFALLPPAVNILVTGLFAGMVLRQYFNRHRAYQLYWATALSMAFLATLAYVLMILVQPTSAAGIFLFRIYYDLGGALVPAWLGLGSIALVSSPRVTRISLIILSLLSVLATGLIFLATINLPKLAQIAGTPGTGTLEPGFWLVTLIVLNTLGVVAVVGVAIYSGWKLIRRQSSMGRSAYTSNVLWANVFILIGEILNATAGSLARFMGVEDIFWLIMALGWLVLFIGVLLASRRSSISKPSEIQTNVPQPVRSK